MADTTQTPPTAPIALTPENVPALMEKHHDRIDSSIGYDSAKQQERLRLYDHDPAAIAAHYPELQKKSQELHERTIAIQDTAGKAGWLAFGAAAVTTGMLAFKKKISQNNLIQGIVVALVSLTAGLVGNYVTGRVLGDKTREESAELVKAARLADARELAVYLEDTDQKLAAKQAEAQQKQIAAGQTLQTRPAPEPRDPSFASNVAAEKSATPETVAAR